MHTIEITFKENEQLQFFLDWWHSSEGFQAFRFAAYEEDVEVDDKDVVVE